jgi:hypothetical protein
MYIICISYVYHMYSLYIAIDPHHFIPTPSLRLAGAGRSPGNCPRAGRDEWARRTSTWSSRRKFCDESVLMGSCGNQWHSLITIWLWLT